MCHVLNFAALNSSFVLIRGGSSEEGWNLKIIKWQKITLQRGSLASYLLSVHFRGKEVQNNVDGNKK